MMLWMYLLDPQNHILKVLCHNLEFWLSYSGSLNKLLTSERREERERGDFSGCLAKCYGLAKGYGWARAAQLYVSSPSKHIYMSATSLLASVDQPYSSGHDL